MVNYCCLKGFNTHGGFKLPSNHNLKLHRRAIHNSRYLGIMNNLPLLDAYECNFCSRTQWSKFVVPLRYTCATWWPFPWHAPLVLFLEPTITKMTQSDEIRCLRAIQYEDKNLEKNYWSHNFHNHLSILPERK